MRFARLLLPLVLGVVLVGCEYLRTPEDQARIDAEMNGSVQIDETEGMTIEGDDPFNDDDAMIDDTDESEGTEDPATGSYGDYSPSVLTNGRTKVLFFHAAWCPICRTANTQLTAWYETHPFPISTYKVDFDTELELRSRYGVTYQHTYVLVDGEGNALNVLQAPTDAQLQAMLQA